MSDKCYYKILEINIDASPALIKKSFKELVKEWHPDRCNHPEAEIRMIEINEAYEVLKDDYKRYMYDTERGYYLEKQKNEEMIFETLTNAVWGESDKKNRKSSKYNQEYNNKHGIKDENINGYSDAFQRYQAEKTQVKKEKKKFDFEEIASKRWFLPVSMFFITILIILFARM